MSDQQSFLSSHSALYFWLSTAAFVIVIAGVRAADTILIPFLLSVFIAIISAPSLSWLQRRGLPSLVALLIVLTGVLAGGMLLVMVLSNSVDKFLQNLPAYQERLHGIRETFSAWLQGWGISEVDKMFSHLLDLENLMGLIGDMLGRLGSTLTDSVLIFLTTLFILLEASSFPTKLRAIYGPNANLGKLSRFLHDIQRYMALKTLISLATGALAAVWVALLGVDFPLLWGLVAFLFNYVPNIGPLIAGIPVTLLALVQHGPASALGIASGYVVINTLLGNIVEPRLMGQGLALSTLVVFLSLVFWGWALGPVGMLLSVPLTMSMKILLEGYEETRWIAIFMGSEEAARGILEQGKSPGGS